jgi:endonuclease/exonuclease/phosphatase family metal-dependent hydrolase
VTPFRFTIATYNIHKCRGLDTRMKPERIADVVRKLDADIVALQEVVRGRGADDQLAAISHGLPGYKSCFGETRKIGAAAYGNAILSRFPIKGHQHYNLTASWREDRGGVRADIKLPTNDLLHLFNLHLGTGYLERRKQAAMLVSDKVLNNEKFLGSRIVLGDFNEWTRGLVTKMVSAHLRSADLRPFLKRLRRRSYPGVLPLMHLDHVYYDKMFELADVKVYRTKLALVASDHLPIVARFERLPQDEAR